MTVDNQPLKALVDGAKESTLIPQSANIPPDVYAGEEQSISLAQGNSILLSGDAIDIDNDPITFQWQAVSASAEAVSMGEDAEGNNLYYPFGDETNVRFSSPNDLKTKVFFEHPGTYRLRLNVTDGKATGYHTVFIEVRH
jgi:hypothetical protein